MRPARPRRRAALALQAGRVIRLALLVALALALALGWAALVWSSARLHRASRRAALLGVASTLVGQAMARGRR